MIDIREETRLVAEPARMARLGLVSLFMTFASFAVAWPLFGEAKHGSLDHFLAWFGVFFFGLCTALIFSSAFGNGRPTLVLNPMGFSFSPVSSDFVPWNAVTHLGEWSMRGQTFIVVGVTNDIWDSPNLTRIARMSRGANRKLGVDGFAIAATGMPMRYEEFRDIFLTYAFTYAPALDASPTAPPADSA